MSGISGKESVNTLIWERMKQLRAWLRRRRVEAHRLRRNNKIFELQPICSVPSRDFIMRTPCRNLRPSHRILPCGKDHLEMMASPEEGALGLKAA
jgi:hypothetical protein